MTAEWESRLEALSLRELTYQHFMEPMTLSLRQLVSKVGALNFQGLQGMGKAPIKRRGRVKKTLSVRLTDPNQSQLTLTVRQIFNSQCLMRSAKTSGKQVLSESRSCQPQDTPACHFQMHWLSGR
jgi:hypothetical protein